MLYAIAIVVSVLVLIADQITKWYFVSSFGAPGSSEVIPFIEGLIQFNFIHNDGGAWGLMSGHTWFLLSMTLLIMIVCVAMLIKNGFKSKLMFFSVCLILSGGIGNMIDRIFRDGKVVDFIQLQFISFPVFNIADCAVCIGAGLLLLYFIVDAIKDYKNRRNNEVAIHNLSAGSSDEEKTE